MASESSSPLQDEPSFGLQRSSGGLRPTLRWAVTPNVVGELEQLSAEYPFREGFHAQLMLALYGAGRQADALVTYREARRTLVDELGIEPNRRLQELEQAILRQDPALDERLRAPPDHPVRPTSPSSPERSVLIVTNDQQKLEQLLAIAEPLTVRPRREIILTALATSSGELEHVSDLLEGQRQKLLGRGVPARAAAFTSASAGSDLAKLAAKQDVDLLLTEAPSEFLADGLPPSDLQTILGDAVCDVATLVAYERLGDGQLAEIVVPFGGSFHEWSALEIGAWLAVSHDASLRLLGIEEQPDRGKRDASGLLADVSLIVQRATGSLRGPSSCHRAKTQSFRRAKPPDF